MESRHWHVTGKVLTGALLIGFVAAGIIAALLIHHGLSARERPTLLESVIAGAVRHLATPGSMRNARNPVPLTPEALADGRAHWADHCVTCHGHDGSGMQLRLRLADGSTGMVMILASVVDNVTNDTYTVMGNMMNGGAGGMMP